MNINLFEEFKEMIESQLKKSEFKIKKEKASVLFGIESMMEGAVDKAELASLNRQYDVAEKQFDQEMLNQKNRIIKESLITMEKLMKQIQKYIAKSLKIKTLRRGYQNE